MGAKGMKTMAKSEIGKELGRNLKNVAMNTVTDSAINLLEGKDLGDSLETGVKSAKMQIFLLF